MNPAIDDIKSDPQFLLWKAWKYVVHKLNLAEHLSPQKCVMSLEYVNKKSLLSYSIVQVFHQEAKMDSWQGQSAAICSIYAERHGYGYVYAHVTPKYQNNSGLSRSKRTMHWARIPVLLWLLDDDPSVNWWLYLDMDAMINPTVLAYPISWIFSAMYHDNGCLISRSTVEPIHLIFFSNANQEPHMPCSGSFLASNSSGNSLELWWNFPGDPYFDSNSEFDQHRVHELMYFKPERFKFAVLDIRQFDFRPSSYILHYSGRRITSAERFRHRISHSIQKSRSIISHQFVKAVKRIQSQETIRCFIDLGVKLYHQHDKKISCWHNRSAK